MSITGFTENPRPEYDVYFMIDLAPLDIDYLKNDINQIFTEGVAHDAIIIGHGDWKFNPLTQDAFLDRQLQLTLV